MGTMLARRLKLFISGAGLPDGTHPAVVQRCLKVRNNCFRMSCHTDQWFSRIWPRALGHFPRRLSNFARLLALLSPNARLSISLASSPVILPAPSLLHPWSSFKSVSSRCLPLVSVSHRVLLFSLIRSLLLLGYGVTSRSPAASRCDVGRNEKGMCSMCLQVAFQP
jgi:hypothetical protein